MLILISIVFMIIGFILNSVLKNKFKKYAQVPLTNGMSGAEVAATMLNFYGIGSVNVTQVDGHLTDHYNPADRTVNLSYDVYHGRNVAAAAVAAHECGHAVQHSTSYAFLQMRSQLVPVVTIAANLQQYLFMFGIAGIGFFKSPILLIIALVAFGITTLFSLITLPVEFDASRRALAWLDESGFARGREYAGAKDALTWAAMTYVSAALAALVQFLYLLWALLGNRD
ncbi:MAG TPA: zinc metallopeptidase [Saprospiraceae bacterium]|nr:zinc metallopeptidase [Saprospiraceae bacterium]HPI08245.1 zinc metallopeptidase [Saprospiraceae bacterium]